MLKSSRQNKKAAKEKMVKSNIFRGSETLSVSEMLSTSSQTSEFTAQESMSKLKDSIVAMTEQIESYKSSFEKRLNEKEKEVERKIEQSQFKYVEMLGIFVAVFSFVSIEFQIIRAFTYWQEISAFTLILLGSLILFAALINRFLSSNSNDSFFILPCLVIASGIGLFYYSPQKTSNDSIQIQTETQNSITDFSKEIEYMKKEIERLDFRDTQLLQRNPYLR